MHKSSYWKFIILVTKYCYYPPLSLPPFFSSREEAEDTEYKILHVEAT